MPGFWMSAYDWLWRKHGEIDNMTFINVNRDIFLVILC